MKDKKKFAAAVSAVVQYIKSEEEAVYLESLAAVSEPGVLASVSVPVKLWGVSGRQFQMQVRNLMQMKTFR